MVHVCFALITNRTELFPWCFSGVGEIIQCLAATADRSLIRLSRNSSHPEFTSDVVFDGATRFLISAFSQCGSFLATVDSGNKLCLCEVESDGISMRLSVTPPAYWGISKDAGMAFLPVHKMLAVIDCSGEDDTVVRLLDMKDLTLQGQLQWQLRGSFPISLALNPRS
jgi:hypothetical protein